MRLSAPLSCCALFSLVHCQRQSTQAEPHAHAPEAATIVSAVPSSVASAAGENDALSARVHLPSGLQAGQRAPLLVLLHGLGSSAEMIGQLSEWPAFAERTGIAWMAPNGPYDAEGRRFWDAGPSCCNFGAPSVDHVSQLHAAIERALAAEPLDRERVFVGGYSNGGFMAHRLACERPELIRGVVSVAGAGPSDRGACKPPVRLKVLQVHGDADPIVTYGGGHLFKSPKLPSHESARKTVADWAESLGCGADASRLPPLDFEASIPGAETARERYDGCRRGSVELWTVQRGGHYVGFRSPGPEAIWAYLSQ
jgi:polyhydroxybutyrate depolymerase